MKKVKICFVIVNCKITGPMNQTLNIIKNINTDFFEVFFITLFQEEEANSMLDKYLEVCSNHLCLRLTKMSSILFGKQKVEKALKQWQPDVIHALGMPPYRLSLGYRKARHIITLRNYAYEDYPSYYNKVIGRPLAFLDISLIKRLHGKGETFVTCSKSLSDIYIKKENIDIPFIRNGVDISRYRRKETDETMKLREKLKIDKEKIVLIYTGPFIERKDQETAIKGVRNSKYFNNLCLVLCGDGTNFEYLKSKYSSENNIIFTGKVKNVSEYLRASDLYLSTSKSEGMPNSVLEAMASGLAVILSEIPQHMELFEISADIGCHYRLGSLEDLTKQINKIIEKDYSKMGENSFFAVTEHLTAKKMSETYQCLYQRMILNQ